MEPIKLSIDSTAITLATLALQNLKVAAEEAAFAIKQLGDVIVSVE